MNRSTFLLLISLLFVVSGCDDLVSESLREGTYDLYSARVSPEPFFEVNIEIARDTIVTATFRSLLDSVDHRSELEVIKRNDDSIIFRGHRYELRLANNEKPEGWLIEGIRRYAVLMELQE